MNDVQVLGFARGTGVATVIIPSPRATEIDDLVLPPLKWKYVVPEFKNSPLFRSALKDKILEYIEAEEPPTDVDLSIKAEYDNELSPEQRELVRLVCLTDLTPQLEEMLGVANLLNESGVPRKDSNVTVGYLRQHHRPMLLAIQDLEKRHRKRAKVSRLVKQNLERIAALPS